MFVIGQFDLVFLKRLHYIYKHRKCTLAGRFLLLPCKTRMFKILVFFNIDNKSRAMQDTWSYSRDMLYIFYYKKSLMMPMLIPWFK